MGKLINWFLKLFNRAMVDDIMPSVKNEQPKPEPLRFPSGSALRIRSVEEFNKIALEVQEENDRERSQK
jgi:hypothetical protein